jgi:hypothetical protein
MVVLKESGQWPYLDTDMRRLSLRLQPGGITNPPTLCWMLEARTLRIHIVKQ